jgi:hypothetical protein
MAATAPAGVPRVEAAGRWRAPAAGKPLFIVRGPQQRFPPRRPPCLARRGLHAIFLLHARSSSGARSRPLARRRIDAVDAHASRVPAAHGCRSRRGVPHRTGHASPSRLRATRSRAIAASRRSTALDHVSTRVDTLRRRGGPAAAIAPRLGAPRMALAPQDTDGEAPRRARTRAWHGYC